MDAADSLVVLRNTLVPDQGFNGVLLAKDLVADSPQICLFIAADGNEDQAILREEVPGNL